MHASRCVCECVLCFAQAVKTVCQAETAKEQTGRRKTHIKQELFAHNNSRNYKYTFKIFYLVFEIYSKYSTMYLKYISILFISHFTSEWTKNCILIRSFKDASQSVFSVHSYTLIRSSILSISKRRPSDTISILFGLSNYRLKRWSPAKLMAGTDTAHAWPYAYVHVHKE